jgi:hypothetical protein
MRASSVYSLLAPPRQRPSDALILLTPPGSSFVKKASLLLCQLHNVSLILREPGLGIGGRDRQSLKVGASFRCDIELFAAAKIIVLSTLD